MTATNAQQEFRFDFRADTKRDIERLVPLAQELAAAAGEHGITCADLRYEAVERKLLTGDEQGRRLSYLGVVMKQAGLVNTGAVRRSTIRRSHGIRQSVWRAP